MKKVLNSDLVKNYIILLVFTTILEASFKLISGMPLFDSSFIRIFIGLNFLSILLSFLLSWLNKTVAKIIIMILCFAFSAYAFFQMGFYNFIGVYASVNASSQLGAVVDYIMDFFGSFMWQYYLEFIPFVLLVLYYIFIDKKFKTKSESKKLKYEPLIRSGISIIALVLVGLLYVGTLNFKFMQNEFQTVSNKDLFKYPTVPDIAVTNFGVLGFCVVDLKTIGQEPPTNDIVVTPNQPSGNTSTDRKFDDSYWKKVIENESDKSLNEISNYLINRSIPNYNDHTGLLKGKNLIVIMMESVNEIIIQDEYKEYFPNIYKMYHEGISFTNNYSPRNNCSTGNNEFSGMTGLYTIQNNCTSNRYRNNKYFTGIFNIFRDEGYRTLSMHNYTEQYYYRSTIHKNIGSEAYYGVEKLGIPYRSEYKNWSSDEDFARVAMDLTLTDSEKPFLLWMTTVSSHQPYNQDSIESTRYYDQVKDLNLPTDIKRFMSKMIILDKSIGILVDRLEKAGELDNTVFAMFADHYPYAISKTNVSKALPYSLEDYEADRTPMLIYNSSLTSEKVEKYSSYMTLTPTLANLFGLNYDPRLYMGQDIFSEDYLNAVVFDNGSWRNDDVFYDASKSKVSFYGDETMSADEIKVINQRIASDRTINTAIIKNNYFKYLKDAIDDLKEKEEPSIPDGSGSSNEAVPN